MISISSLDDLTTLPVMMAAALLFASLWGFALGNSQRMISQKLIDAEWWPLAVSPTKSMMHNFGYPNEPTKRFPDGVTEVMAREFYAYTINICVAHAICASPMIPVLMYGWEKSSELMRALFVLGTLADLGFDVYDSIQLSFRAFSKHNSPIPIDFWAILVCLHHTTAMFLVMPLNMRYVHRFEYHQTAVSLLFAASLCFLAGAYKFTLDVYKKKADFILYKMIVLFQLAVILYTRIYLWFPSALSLRAHMQEQNDTTFFQAATVMITIFSVFNVILVVDALGAAAKWLPRKFPKSEDDRAETASLVRRTSGVAIASPTFQMLRMLESKRKVKASVHVAMAVNLMRRDAGNLLIPKKKD